MTDSNEAKQPHAKPFVSSVTSNSSLAPYAKPAEAPEMGAAFSDAMGTPAIPAEAPPICKWCKMSKEGHDTIEWTHNFEPAMAGRPGPEFGTISAAEAPAQRDMCPSCKGTGTVETAHTLLRVCSACDGTGEAAAQPDTAEEAAKDFHETYERLAPQFGYETRKESAKPWAEIPENNRKLMIAVAGEVIQRAIVSATAQLRHELAQARKERDDENMSWSVRYDSEIQHLQDHSSAYVLRIEKAEAEIKRLREQLAERQARNDLR